MESFLRVLCIGLATGLLFATLGEGNTLWLIYMYCLEDSTPVELCSRLPILCFVLFLNLNLYTCG